MGERDLEQAVPQLPPDFYVERRGIGEERHIALIIEGSLFELRADDALALGRALVHHAEGAEKEDAA